MGNVPLSRDRLREIFMEGYEEGRARQIARRAEMGLPPLPSQRGMKTFGDIVAEVRDALIREDENLEPVPHPVHRALPCDRCDGARFLLKRDVPGYTPQLVACPACYNRQATAMRSTLAAEAGIVGRMALKTFSSFKHVKGVEDAVAAAALWANEWAISDEIGGKKWLVVNGPRGAGKTHLGLACANLLVDLGLRVRWFYTADLLDMARSLYGGKDGGEDKALAFRREVAHAPILILDEFGALATAGTDMVSRFIEPLIDQRYRESKPTLFTLKGTPRQVREAISDSVGRRLEDEEICSVVTITAPQYLG